MAFVWGRDRRSTNVPRNQPISLCQSWDYVIKEIGRDLGIRDPGIMFVHILQTKQLKVQGIY